MNLDYDNLSGKLSMSKLLGIEPAGLRKFLKLAETWIVDRRIERLDCIAFRLDA